MKFIQMVRYCVRSIIQRKGKLWLTILGIVIGIAAVVSLLTIGEGFNDSVKKELESFSANTIYVLPYSESALQSGSIGGGLLTPSSGKLTERDVEALRKVPELQDITRLTERRATVEYKGKAITATINGIEPALFQKMSFFEVAEGRFLLDNDRKVVGLGSKMAAEGFGSDKKVNVNSYLTINGKKYRVICILKESGSSFGSDLDNGIFIHYEDSKEVFNDSLGKDEMDYIAASVAEGSNIKAVVEKVKAELDSSRKVKPDDRDYSVLDSESIMQTVSSVLSLVTVFLGAIAAISLVVGGLSIASSMFTSVLERTKEIGIMKSVGADRNTILSIFLFEAGLLGMLGGIVGVAVGAGTVYLAGIFGLSASFNLGIAIFGVVFAFLVGLVSGFFPAKSAADLSPVEALRYE
ncbi:MAG: ABC transporter permease [Candidatus Micrarchaeota archaeon]|nr:ABC transporter permease [Candidatus Micrarchaeota archaeon]